MIKNLLVPVLLAAALGGIALAPNAVEASGGSIVTQCEPFQPSPGVNHQKCTRYHYGADGTLLFASVYYIDDSGMWYLLP